MFELIPAIDLKSGRCVRLVQGRMDQETRYFEDPLEAANLWVAQGAPRLHLVDLDGALSGSPRNLAAVQRIVENVSIPTQLGGGMRGQREVDEVLRLGVERVILGTLACQDPRQVQTLAAAYPQRILLALDAKDGFVAVKGWVDVTRIRVTDLLDRFSSLPLAGVVYTDIHRDGMLTGPNLPAIESLVSNCPFPVIASGGIATLADVLALSRMEPLGLCGAIVGKALYSGSLSYPEAIRALRCRDQTACF